MGQVLTNMFVAVDDLPKDGYGWIQLLFLGAVYGYILMNSANLIKDGSELLLLIPSWAGLVGSIVLPVLGAVPDGAIVLFSGLGPNPQSQLSVGVGALAGSTIMLLTVPWFLSLWAGRVDLDADGNGNYVRPHGAGSEWQKLSSPYNIVGTGVNMGSAIHYSAKITGLTLVTFLVIQIPALFSDCATKRDEDSCNTPRVAALIGGILTIILFCFYLWDQKRIADRDVVAKAKREAVQKKALDNHLVSLKGLFAVPLAKTSSGQFAEEGDAINMPLTARHDDADFRKFLRPYFKRFDRDGNGVIDSHELKFLLETLGERPTVERVDAMMRELDRNNSGGIDFDEFVVAMVKVVQGEPIGARAQPPSEHEMARRDGDDDGVNSQGSEAGDDEEEEDEEMPEDLADLSPEEQRSRILRRAFLLMSIGTVVVVIFSDPMVDILNELGTRLDINPFYVAFVIAPLVSNGSELIAAYSYAAKKTEKTITISFATLIGSSAMNNTFCLGIFLFLVFFKKLQWVFTAEVTSILFVELFMIGLVHFCGRTMKAPYMFLVGALFPLSVALVAGLEAAGLD